MNILSSLLAAATFVFATSTAFAAPVHALNDQAPVGFVVSTFSFSGNARGWEFVAGAANLEVSQLGIAPASGGSYTLSLWDVASQSVLSQTTLASSNAGVWNWVNLATSVSLTQGASYMIMGIGNDQNQLYYFNNNLAPSWYPTGDIQYTTMKYCNSCTANTFPLNTLNGYQYGLVDIGYSERASTTDVPEPGSLALFGLGLLAAGALRRKASV